MLDLLTTNIRQCLTKPRRKGSKRAARKPALIQTKSPHVVSYDYKRPTDSFLTRFQPSLI